MRIPSLLKVEKQVGAWLDRHPVVMSVEWESEYQQKYQEFLKLRTKWEKIQENECPVNHGGKCTCKEHPLYKELYEGKVIPLCNLVSKMDHERFEYAMDVEEEMYQRYLSTREAKIKYRANRIQFYTTLFSEKQNRMKNEHVPKN